MAFGKCRDLHFRPSGRGDVACPCRPDRLWDKDIPEKKIEMIAAGDPCSALF